MRVEREVPECKEQEYEAATASSPLHTAAARHEPTKAVDHQSNDDDDAATGTDTDADADALADHASLPYWRRRLARLIPQTLMGWPLLITYFLLTFAQELPTTAVGLMLAQELHFQPGEVSRFYAATFVPWTIRPVYAFVSDQIPLFSYRRRPYFIICALFACGAQISLSLLGHSKYNFLVLAVATQLFLAFCEVVCDSLSVEWGNELAVKLVAAQLAHAKAKAVQEPEQAESAGAPLRESSSWLRGRSKSSSEKEWATPLLSDSSANSVSDGINGVTVHAVPTVCSSPSTPLVPVASAASSARSDGANRSYCSLSTEDEAEDPTPKSLHCMVADDGASLLQSPCSAGGSALSQQHEVDPADARADAMAARVIAHLFATTPDISTLTPLVLKSRIQSECMSIRTSGSVVASALSTWVLLHFLSPRSVLMWSALAFVLGIFSMVFFRLERKVGRGYFGLAATGTDGVTTATAAAAAGSAPVVVHPLAGATTHGAGSAQVDAATIAIGVAVAEDDAAVNMSASAPAALSTSAGSPSAGASSSAAAADPTILMMERSRWVFLWQKLMSLLRALRLLLGPLLFIFLVNVMPSPQDAYYNYLYSDYWDEFTNSQFSSFNFLGLVGSLLGCLLYQRFVARTRIDIRLIFLVTTVLSAGAGCTQMVLATKSNHRLGIGDEWWLLVSSLVVSGFQILAQLPPIILASHFAPRGLGLEASMFSLFAASAHLGALVSAEVTAHLTVALGISQGHWANLWQLILVCNLCTLLPLIVMPILLHPKVTGRTETSDAADASPKKNQKEKEEGEETENEEDGTETKRDDDGPRASAPASVAAAC